MQDCHVCGRRFDPLGFQVVVPELALGFDRVECARSARALGRPAKTIATGPLAPLAEPIALVPASARVPALRALRTPAATLGLLAAGTAAAALLWLRALETDSASFDLARPAAPRAVAQETVAAHVRPVPLTSDGPVDGVLRERTAPVSVAPLSITTVPIASRRPTASPARHPQRGSDGSGRDVARPPAPSEPTVSARTTGKDHVKRGLGHYKHGESDGVHSPGHGGGNGRGHGASNGGGHGHGKGHGKKH